jgi:hypothetical protein
MINRRFEYIRNQITDEILMEQQKSKILMEQQKSNNEKIQQLKEDIAINKEKLQKLEELQRTKSPAEEAFKKVFRYYPYEKDFREGIWFGFEKGYNASQEPEKEQKWEVEKLQEKNWYVDAKDLIESETSPQEPTSTVFRQKLFDGIKSVFYDPEYERTHWKLKVDMAVDEVLTHFYDILPEPQEPDCDEFVKGWNCCLAEIEACMEFSDD